MNADSVTADCSVLVADGEDRQNHSQKAMVPTCRERETEELSPEWYVAIIPLSLGDLRREVVGDFKEIILSRHNWADVRL